MYFKIKSRRWVKPTPAIHYVHQVLLSLWQTGTRSLGKENGLKKTFQSTEMTGAAQNLKQQMAYLHGFKFWTNAL